MMSDLATLLDHCPRVLVGHIPMRGKAMVIGDPYFVTPGGALNLPLRGPDTARHLPVYLLRTAVPGWGAATWRRGCVSARSQKRAGWSR